MTNNLTPKPIVDKNGKVTTVHVKNESATTSDAKLNVAPKASVASEYTKRPVKSLAEIQAIAKAIHPDAKVGLEDGRWTIHIVTDFDESFETPESFAGTYAGEAYESTDGGENMLLRWASKNGHNEHPLEVVGEYYNLQHEGHRLRREWLENRLAETGGRPEVVTGSVEYTDTEREVVRAYFDERGPAHEYAREKLKDRYAALWALGF